MTPEGGGFGKIVGLAIDHKGAQSAVMHGDDPVADVAGS